MDLCLKGSQINLVTRQRPKPKYSSQTNLHQPHSRPRSATFFQKRSRSSPFLCRPQSADPKFGRNFDSACGHYCSENDFSGVKFNKNNQKRFESVSSSNLLKLLLDEPIKRSWLCRRSSIGGGGSSPDDDQSELSTSRKTSSYSSLNKRTRTESVGGSSAEGDSSEKFLRHSLGLYGQRKVSSRLSSGSSMSNLSKEKSTFATTYKTAGVGGEVGSSDYWLSNSNYTTSTLLQKSSKPDLPGRVSFCKASMQNDLDSSDCDNDRQEQYNQFANSSHKTLAVEDISAPGPVTIKHTLPSTSSSSFTTYTKVAPVVTNATSVELSSASLKKSVHFGASAGEDVLAETYEYPKCPSENCSCSTRSSSTASIHDALDVKCACDSPTCRYAMDANRKPNSNVPRDHKKSLESRSKTVEECPPPIEESAVIREYKNAVGEQLENSVVKNILEEGQVKPKLSSFGQLNNAEVSTYLGRYVSPPKADIVLEKQNNLSESKSPPLFKSSVKRNLVSTNELLKTENNLDHNLTAPKAKYTSSSETVINNYLKVSATAPIISKKKENNKPSSAESIASNMKKSKSAFKTEPISLKTKTSSSSASTDRSKLKKATSFGSLRDDSNLNEFNLDKVDSWMSMHEQTLTRKSLAQHSSLEEDFEKFTKESLMLDGDDEPADTNSQISTKSDGTSQEESTYDEIVSVIKEIEEDKKKDNYAERGATEMDLKLSTPSLIAENTADTSKANEILKSEDKYKDILNYLDNVEDSCDKTLLETRRSMPDTNRSEVEFVVEPDIAEDVPKLSDLLMLPNHQLARRIVGLSLRANELANGVHLAKEHVMKIRTEKQKTIRAEKSNSAARMRDQKKHYETIVQRHQGFIEQLLKDKGSLCEKVAALTRRLESQNQAWEHKLETEVARVKETTMAGEKIRRERWVRENTKKIKELTVKGLEMEINKMSCNHQREITELKREHQQQLLDALEEARLKHEQIESGIRESCTQDRETIIEKERMAIRERFERQLEEEHKSFDEQKQKLCDDFAAERERLQRELKVKDVEYQTRRQEMQRENDSELEQAIAELQEKMSKQDEKYQNRINTIEKQFESDFEIWKKEYENSCKMTQVDKENTIRQHYRTERDRQIDDIVSRMDAEALKNAEDFEAKIIRLKEKHEKDLHEVESVEKSLREKYTETRSKLGESDAQVRNYQAELKQMQIELGHSKKMCSEFLTERDQLRENLRNEIQTEVATLKSERDNEIQKIHKRVQQAIEKKDATIDILQKENGSLRERCLKLEAVIRQQRKDYCVK